MKWGYHQLELEPESRDITTFATHSGLFRYKRLLFGLSSASEQYQHEIARVIAGIDGAENISDDIVVHGVDKASHDEALHKVLRRLQENGLTINLPKCQFGMSRVGFMGMMLTEKGTGPTDARVKVIQDAREPSTQAEVRSFLGLANSSARFIPGYATVVEPLRHLLVKDAEFEFGPEQKAAFQELKDRMAEAATLAYFDKNARTIVIADASPVGLGVVLAQIQDGNPVPVYYASRALTWCEQRYSQTEKEALGLVWACERFHLYIYGKSFELRTDHKPLEAIYAPKSKPCARIERWVLRLQQYDFKVVYVAGSRNVADPLSRLLGPDALRKPAEHHHGADEYIRFVAVSATPSVLTTREIEEASGEDPELEEVRKAVMTGHFEHTYLWPVNCASLDRSSCVELVLWCPASCGRES